MTEEIMQKRIVNFWRGIEYCSKYLECKYFDEDECDREKEKDCYEMVSKL